MTFAISEKIGIPNQRGFRLRCFLGVVIWMLLGSSMMCNVSHAQIAIETPVRLSHVGGVVVNSSGNPAVDAEVTLERDDEVLLKTRTDQSGAFHFDHAAGQYWLHVARTDSAPAGREIVVTDEIVTALERKKLYIILGPGACQDDCSSVLTSRRDFDRAIRKLSRH